MLTWYLVAGRYTPARVTGNIIPIVPQVSGEVVAVNVGVNARVKRGVPSVSDGDEAPAELKKSAAGNYATAGQAIMAFVSSETVWIEAYMRENSLGNVKPGDPVDSVLDGAVLPLIMLAMLSQKPDFSTGAADGKALIAANIAGGLVTVLLFQFLQVSPNYLFLVTGFFALALMFGRGLFSNRPIAPLFGSAFSTVLILIGSATGTFSEDAGSEFYQRIVLIILAVCYVVGALCLLQSLHVRARWMRAGHWLSAKLSRVARLMPGH